VVTNKSVPRVAPRDLPKGQVRSDWPFFGEPMDHTRVPYEWAVTNFAACYFVERRNEDGFLQINQRKPQSHAPFYERMRDQFGMSRPSVERTIDGTRWMKSADVGRFLRHPDTSSGMRDVIDGYRVLHKSQTQPVAEMSTCVAAIRLAMLDSWKQNMTLADRKSVLAGLEIAVGELLNVGAELEMSLANMSAPSTADVKWIQFQQHFANAFGSSAATPTVSLTHLSLSDHIRSLIGIQPTTIAEVYVQLASTRPGADRGKVASTLSQLTRKGELERVAYATYRKPSNT
jgi:hypothetical protein